MSVDLSVITRSERDLREGRGQLLTRSMFRPGSDQRVLEAMVEAMRHEISLGAGGRARPRAYLGIGVLPGETFRLEATLTIDRLMGGMIVGPGKRVSESTGHDAYAQNGHIRAAPGFAAGTPLISLADVAGLTIRGLNVRGHATGERVPVGIATTSNAGAGTSNLLIDDCAFVYCATAVSFGHGTGSPMLDSDCTLHRCDFAACDIGVRTVHNQSLVHSLARCAWNGCGLGVLISHGGYMQVRMAHTFDLPVFMRISQIASNGGEVLIDGLRMDGTAHRTRVLDIEATQLGYGYYTIRGAHRIAGQPTDTVLPAVMARSRSSVVIERSDLGPPSTLGDRWAAVQNGADNADLGLVTIRSCNLGTPTASEVAGDIILNSCIQIRDCYESAGGGGFARVANTDLVGMGEG